MAQSDLTIQNQSFPSFRADLNDALSAINSFQSGTSRPASAVVGTIWLDLSTGATTPTLKYYDGADDISLATLDHASNTVNWLDSTVAFDIINDITPQLGGMLDVNGQAIGDGTLELIKFSETASAVNEITVTNSATGTAPEISATGDDTDVDLKITPKGAGNLILDGFEFPNTDGTAGQVLQTDGYANLSFGDAGSYTNSDALTLFNASGSAPVYACRAWVNFNGTGTVAIREDGNVTSITDNGVGNYTVNFTTAMPDANYTVTTAGFEQEGLFTTSGFSSKSGTVQTTTSIRGTVISFVGSFVDVAFVHVAIFR